MLLDTMGRLGHVGTRAWFSEQECDDEFADFMGSELLHRRIGVDNTRETPHKTANNTTRPRISFFMGTSGDLLIRFDVCLRIRIPSGVWVGVVYLKAASRVDKIPTLISDRYLMTDLRLYLSNNV